MNTDTYKNALLEERATLDKELREIAVYNEKTGDWEAVPQNIGDDTADLNDVADRFEDFGERSGELAVLEARWMSVEGALKRIENGTYGTCSVCGEKIEEDRLGANPAADTCKAHMN